MSRVGNFTSLTILAVAVILAVIVGWSAFDGVARIAFGALCLLAVYVVMRGPLAMRDARSQLQERRSNYMDHQYFTYVALWEGFLIVAILNSGLPGWFAAVVAIALPIVGARLFHRYKRHVLAMADAG